MDIVMVLAKEVHKRGGTEGEFKELVDWLNDLGAATGSDPMALAQILWESMLHGGTLEQCKHQLQSGISTSSKHLSMGC